MRIADHLVGRIRGDKMAKNTRAPYQVGDAVRALFEGRHGTTLGTLYVERVTALTDGRWRIECPRDHHSCPTVAFTVDQAGKDAHGYCWPAPAVMVTL